jgi:hypothetical protein
MSNGFLCNSDLFTATAGGGVVSGTSAAFLSNDFMGMVLRFSAGTPFFATIDFGAANAIDTFALLNTNLPVGAAWYLQGSSASDFSSGYDSGPIADGGEISNVRTGRRHLLLTLPTQQSFRYWRVVINGVTGVQLEAARLIIGRRTLYARNFEFGAQRGVRDLGEVEFGPAGALLRRAGRVLRTLGISFPMVTQQETEFIGLRLLETLGNTGFVFACLDDEASQFRSERMYFGPLEGNLAMTWRAHDTFEKRLQLVSVI